MSESATEIARRGQESLHEFLLTWNEMINVIAAPQRDLPAATQELKALRESCRSYLKDLEAAAAAIDSASAPQPTAVGSEN